MKQGEQGKDSAGRDWTVWDTHWTGSLQGDHTTVTLAYNTIGEVKAFVGEQLKPVEEDNTE